MPINIKDTLVVDNSDYEQYCACNPEYIELPYDELISLYAKQGLTLQEAQAKAGKTYNWTQDGKE